MKRKERKFGPFFIPIEIIIICQEEGCCFYNLWFGDDLVDSL
jgi:hypothetical protein